jgi:glycosyltransferase involved in cell wall biosynthesis
MLVYAAMLARVAELSDHFDVVHAHIDWIHIPLLRSLGVPFVTTLHGRLDHPALATLCTSCFPGARFVSISDAQRNPLPHVNWAATVYHGLPENLLTPNYEPKGYLAFLGRITPDKGPETAIQLARAAGLPLKIAAKIVRSERRYFTQRIEPLLDGTDVEFVGEIDEAHKAEFLGNAAALLFPIDWPEPFGLVMIEAMACGTPVVAFRCGSVPEVIDDGITGYAVEPDYGVNAISRAVRLNRKRVRQRFEERFTGRRMAQDYVGIYDNILNTSHRFEGQHESNTCRIGAL